MLEEELVPFCVQVSPSMMVNSHVGFDGVTGELVEVLMSLAATVTGLPVSTSLFVEEMYGTRIISSKVSIMVMPALYM